MKKLMVVLATLSVGWLAKADDGYQYLYWQIDESQVDPNVAAYDAAMLYQLDGSGEVLSYVERPENVDTKYWTSERQMTDMSGFSSGDSFIFELLQWDYGNSAWKTVGVSPTYDYGFFSQYLSTFAGGTDIPTQGEGGIFTPSFAVPEPTSGALLLIGLVGLALRRKQA